MSRALITGIEGFTGRYMAQILESMGHEVLGISRNAQPADSRILEADINDAKAVREAVARIQPEIVVHLAGIAFAAHGDVQQIYQVNLVGSRNLLAALADCPRAPEAVLFASSANVYGNSTAGVIDESIAPAPANDYSVAKLAMEYLPGLWSPRIPVTIARPFNYTGVGQSHAFLLPKIVDHFKRKAPIIELGNLDVERDFSDVRFVVECYARLLLADCPGRVFNVCSGEGHTLRQVLTLVAELTGYSPEVRVNPAFVRANEIKKLVGNKAALDRAIGAVPMIPLRETLRWMLES